MNETILMWAKGILTTALLGLLTYMVRAAFLIIKDLLTNMLNELRQLNGKSVEHGVRIDKLESVSKDHEDRLREIEKS